MDFEKVMLLIKEGEGLTVEFKEKYTSRIDEDLVAFSNTKGGTLLLGVCDDGTIAGERLTNELKARITSLARNCVPSISTDISQSGKVVVINVPEGTEKPYSCGSGYFRRLNGTTQKMSRDEIRIMFSESNVISFEEKTVKGFTFNEISRVKINAFIKEAGITAGKISTADFLQSLKVADRIKIKNAGILFFAMDVNKYLPQAQMTLIAFKGTKKVHIFDRRDVRDDLLTQFNEAIIFIKKHLNVRSEIRGVNREDIYEIPIEAIREAVVNAIMHRDYSITGTQVSIEVYDDRLEIVNPGGLPPGLPKKAFGTISVRRNELISDLFFRLHKVERVGMGIQRMKESMADAELHEPVFDTNGFFRIILMRPQTSGSVSKDEKTTQKSSQKTTQKIIDLIKQNPYISRNKLANVIGISEEGIKYNLNKLKEKGLLKRIGPDKGGYWEVVE